MSTIVVKLHAKGLTEKQVLSYLRGRRKIGGQWEWDVSKQPKAPTSRSERFEHAKNLVSEARDEFQELHDELESWKDNLPENMQDGNKASELEDAMSELEDCVNDCENVDGHDVMFPGMY